MIKHISGFLLVPAATILIAACGTGRKAVTGEHIVMDTVTVSAKNNPLDIYRATRPRYWDITHTRAALRFNLQERTIAGMEDLYIHPYCYPMDSLVLDAKSVDVSRVEMVLPAKDPSLRYTQQEDKLNIYFKRAYRQEDSLHLRISYLAKPYAAPTGGSKAITDDRGAYFINTDNSIPGKPVQVWSQGETEANSHWLPTLDQPNERFTVELALTVPDTFITLSNGQMTGSRKDAAAHERTDTWRMDKPIQTYAIMFAIGKFAVIKDREWNGREVSYYVEPEYAPYARMMFNNTPDMIAYFSKFTGVPYPWNKYSQVVVRDYVSGAMENTSASLFGEFLNQDLREIKDKNNEDVVSHELFHQWFGDYVTAESWSNLTLNESFANYGEQLWRRYRYGNASADELAYTDLQKYLGSAEYNDEPLLRFHYADKEDMFDRISYEKGGATLHYLHCLAGDQAFSKAMNIYLTRNALQPAEVSNWRMAVEEATGLDWNWFFDQWYYRGGHPVLNLKYEYDDVNRQLKLNVTQTATDSGSAYQLPLKAALVYNSEMEVIDWRPDTRKQVFTYPYRNGIKPVFIPDYEHWLVGGISEKKSPVQWLTQLRASSDYINKRRAVSGAFLNQQDSISQVIFHLALKDSLSGIRTYTLSLLERMPDKYKWWEQFKNDVLWLAINDGSNKVRAYAFDVLGKWKAGDAREEMAAAVGDSSYMVAGSALTALREVSKDTAYMLAKQIYRQEPKADLATAVWTVLGYAGKPEDISLFEQRAQTVYGGKKMAMVGQLYLYELNTKNIGAYERGLQLLTTLAKNEAIKSYRVGIGSIVFGLYNYYREKVKSNQDKEKQEDLAQRLSLAEKYKNEVAEAETDEENLKKYRQFDK